MERTKKLTRIQSYRVTGPSFFGKKNRTTKKWRNEVTKLQNGDSMHKSVDSIPFLSQIRPKSSCSKTFLNTKHQTKWTLPNLYIATSAGQVKANWQCNSVMLHFGNLIFCTIHYQIPLKCHVREKTTITSKSLSPIQRKQLSTLFDSKWKCIKEAWFCIWKKNLVKLFQAPSVITLTFPVSPESVPKECLHCL